MILAGSCGTSPAKQKATWSLQLTTSGGFAGIGNGNLSVDSEGRFKYESPARPADVHKGCEGKLTNDQVQLISDAVEKSDPEHWNRPELNVAAPDAFGYKLELRAGSKVKPTTVQWYDNTRDQLPDDLKQLSAALMQIMKTACRREAP